MSLFSNVVQACIGWMTVCILRVKIIFFSWSIVRLSFIVETQAFSTDVTVHERNNVTLNVLITIRVNNQISDCLDKFKNLLLPAAPRQQTPFHS